MSTSLRVDYPDHTSSPVAHLLPDIGPSLLRIAPERRAEFERLTHGVTLAITDNTKFICQASRQWKLIQISTRVVELVWAFAYAYWSYYSLVLAGQQPGGRADLGAYPKLQPSLHLLKWALTERTKGLGEPWPEDLPGPHARPDYASPEHVADEATLCSLAFYLHHELAHTYLTHPAGLTRLAHERQCDQAAANWCLGAAGLEPLVLQKRALGVATGLLVIAVRGIHTGEHDGVEHPLDFERLFDSLDAHLPPDQEGVWAMVVAVLALHTSAVDLSPPPGEFHGATAFRDAALGYRQGLRDRHEKGTTTSAER